MSTVIQICMPCTKGINKLIYYQNKKKIINLEVLIDKLPIKMFSIISAAKERIQGLKLFSGHALKN